MPRYFIEVSYKGAAYSGFQVQQNSVTIQSEVEKALQIFFKQSFSLTGSSRTDAGVHALQNYFHFDVDKPLRKSRKVISEDQEDFGVYHLNAILPKDIVVKRIFQVEDEAHSRFDAVARKYKYYIYQQKNPFLQDTAFYFPYKLDIDELNKAAILILNNKDFTSFSKRNTQVNNFICDIQESEWTKEEDTLIYTVKGNRFLRGMVKGLAGTMLKVGTHKISIDQFNTIINNKDCTKADFSVPPHALFLVEVLYN